MNDNLLKKGKPEWHELSKTVSANGTVLLKNDNNVLPLSDKRISVFGRVQLNTMGHAGCANFSDAFISAGIAVNTELLSLYRKWTEEHPVITGGYVSFSASSYPEMPLSEETVKNAAIKTDTAVVILGRTSCENCDIPVAKGGFMLSDGEEEMFRLVCGSFRHVIVLLNISCAVELTFLDKYSNIDAVLFTGFMGENSACAVADILIGKINPSGKLPFTMARSYECYPSSGHFGQHEGGLIQDYEEDIFVGYRYFDTFSKENEAVFPFGYGLSYTDFSVSNAESRVKGDAVEISADITNIGNVPGREVAEFFFSAPQLKDGAKLGKPFKELCGFAKTRELLPGESEGVKISLPLEQMSSYDDTGVLGTKSVFVTEKGEYRFFVSQNGKTLTAAGAYYQNETRITRHCRGIETTLPKRLLANGEYEALPQPVFNSERPIAVSPNSQTVISAADYCRADIPLHTLAELKRGESVTYRLLPGICGRYTLTAENCRLNRLFSFSLDGLELNNPTADKDSGIEIILPLSVCELRLTALDDIPDISELRLTKVNVKTVIKPDEKNIVEAKDMYEGSFYINLENYTEDDGCTSCCITNIFLKGMYATYKLSVEKEGYYNISFRYSYTGETTDISEIMTVIIANVICPVGGVEIKKTCESGRRKFTDSDTVTVFLPKGTVYFQVASRAGSREIPFPDLSRITFSYSPNAAAEKGDSETENPDLGFESAAPIWQFNNITPKGIQLKDVYLDRTKTDAFLEQLSNEEIAMLLSGDSKNAVIYGGVGCTHPIAERGVPPVQTVDSPMDLSFGLPWSPPRNPSTLILTASFDKSLYEYYGDVMGDAANAFNVGFWLAPAVNILRNPCGGRCRDYSSEDPYLSGIYAKHVIDGVNKHGVAAILKHYCANNTEFERLKSNSRVSERALREIYMKAFEIAVKGTDVAGIMTSYNSVNDRKVCVDPTLITDIPRKEWNWEGAFMTDWWNDTVHAEEIAAGHDIKMTNGDIEGVAEALNTGRLSREQTYTCAKRVIRLLLKLKSVHNSF
mgnify:FL=1